MLPKLALLICAIYVLFLLRLEHRQSPSVSWALWIPTVWMLVIAGKPLGIWFGSGDRDAGSPLDQVFLIAVLCLGLCILASRRFDISLALKGNTALMVLLGYSLMSVFWSEIPFISFKRWTREVIAVVMALLVLSEREPRQAMLSLLKRTICILIPFSLILIKYFPEYGIQYRWNGGQMWTGVTLQKNGLGRLCLIAAFFFVWTFVRRRQGRGNPIGKYQALADASLFILIFYLLSGPGGQYSATALISFCAGLLTFAGLLWSQKHQIFLGVNTLTMMMVAILSLGTLQPFLGGSIIKDAASSVGRDATLTGRTEIWAGLLPDVMRSPFLGSGFASYWTAAVRKVHEAGEAHSGYLDILLERGFLGLLFVSLFILSSCRKAQRELRHDFDWACLWICFLVMTMIHNFSESSISSFATQLMAVLLFLAVLSSKQGLSYTSEVKKLGMDTRDKKIPMSRKKITNHTSARRAKLCKYVNKT